MRRKILKKNNISAFTLTELLVTIVIITVLSAVVFGIAPNFIRTLKQARLDKNAETVYYAVQNRMTELRTSGRSEEYQPENSNGKIIKFDSAYSFDVVGDDGQPPIDQMAYFSADWDAHSALTSTLLPRDRIDETLWDGNWIVEFNYESGTVWGVFYIEDTSVSDYDPDLFNSLRDDSNRLNNYDSYKAGYYGKGTSEFHPGEDKYDKPKVKITNEEKLIATLSCDVCNDDDTYVNFYYIIHQIDDDNPANILGKTEKTYKTENVLPTGNKFTVDVVLDSLDSTFYSNFVGVTDANALEPGANMLIEVWVVGEHSSEESEHTKDPNSCKFNSLFSDETIYKDNCAVLSYGRHLQNLNSATSHVSSNITKAKIASKISNISFSSGSPWAIAYNSKKFVPIRNKSLESFDGSNKSIAGLDVIAQTDKNAGLFDTFYGNEIKDLTLISPVAKDVSEAAGAGSSGHVGLLSGELAVSKNTTISNITITKPGTSGATENVPTATSHLGNAGGLIGMVSCSSGTACQLTIDNIKIDNVDVESVSGATQSGNAGGLIGEIGSSDKLTVALSDILLNDPSRRSDSSQRFIVKSTRNNAGGFVGSSSAILQIPAATMTTDNNGDSNATAQNQVSAYDIEVSTIFGADETKGNAGGVVGYLNANTKISNLYLAHVTIAVGDVDGDVACMGSGGGVFGLVTAQVNNSSNISGITFAATDRSEDLPAYPVNITGEGFYAGGFAGCIKGSPVISGIKFDQGVSVSISGAAVGGFVGSVHDASFSSCTINKAYVQGEESTSDTNRKGDAGGFAGQITGNASINNCSVKNTKVFSQSGGAGGFIGVGSSDFSASTNSCIDTEVLSQGASDQDTGCYAGGFAGHISGGNPTISSFQFRYSSADSNKLPELGISSSNKTIIITDTKQSTAGSAIAGRTATGGIIGAITGGRPKIETSFSATILGYYSYHEGSTDSVVFKSGSTGGLVGYYSDSGNCVIEKSYADSYMFGKTVGGLLGGSGTGSNSPTIKNCYAAGYLIGSDVQAGLSAGTYLTTTGGNYTVCCPKGTGTTIYSTANSISDINNTYYLFTGSLSSGTQINTSWLSDCQTFADKLGKTVFSVPSGTVKYNRNTWKTTASIYPYPQITGISAAVTYGDWENYGHKAQFVYFEYYSSLDQYRVYYYDNGTEINTLLKNGDPTTNVVNGDGYGILSETWDTGTCTLKLQGSTTASFLSPKRTITVVADSDGTSQSMSLQILDPKYSEGTNPLGTGVVPLLYAAELTFNNCYGRSNSDKETFSFNPRTAECIIPTGVDVPEEYDIRSPRQLYALSETYSCYKDSLSGCSYVQKLDLDYSSYSWSPYSNGTKSSDDYFVQQPIGGDKSSGSVSFTQTYDGSCCEIRNLSLTTSQNKAHAGLFAIIGGTVQNVFMVNEYSQSGNYPAFNLTVPTYDRYNKNYGIYVGILAGEVESSGNIKNCAVCGYRISLDFEVASKQNNRYIGGLVGQNKGTINNCSVAIRDFSLTHALSWSKDHIRNITIGGLAGTNSNEINNCYAIVGNLYHEIYYSYHKGNSDVAGFVGNNTGKITKSYSMVGSDDGSEDDEAKDTSRDTGLWYGFTDSNGTEITDCYWLNTTTWKQKQRWWGKEWVHDTNPLKSYALTKPYQDHDRDFSTVATKVNYSEMQNKEGSIENTIVKYSSGTSYPFRAVVQKNGTWIHYGDWPVATTTFALADFTLTSNTSQLTLNENDSTIVYITEADSETGDKIEDQIPLLASVSGGNVTVTEAAGDEYDDNLGKTVEEVVDPVTGDLPGAIPFLVTAVHPGEDAIQVDQKEVLDDAFVALYGMDDEGDTDTDTVNLEEETAKDNNDDSDCTTSEQSALPDEIQLSENYDDDEVEEAEYALQAESSPESDEEKIYILTTPLTLSVNVYRNAHVGIIPCQSEEESDSYPEFCSTENDMTLPAQELGGEYPDEDSVVGAYNVDYPLTYGLEEDYNENTNLFLYLARDASIETSQSALAIQNVTVIRHVTSLTEILDQTYELYNREDNEANLWNYEDYFFKTGEPFIEQNEDYCYTYLPVTFTGKYDDPVTICVTVTYGNDTYHLSYDMDVVQNKFKVTYQDGFFTIREDVLDYGSVFTIPTKSEIDELYNSWEDSKKQEYDSNKEGYIYPEIVDEDQGESIWTSNQVLPLYEDVTYQLRREPISYTISFSPNGGEGEMESVSAVYDKLVDLPHCSYTKADCSFAGWALEVTAEEIDWFPDESSVYPLCDVDGGEVTLYAMWNQLPSDEEPEEPEDKEAESSENTKDEEAENSENTKDEEKELTEENSEKKSEEDSNVSSPQNGQSSADPDTNNDTSGEKGADSSAVSQSGEEDIASDSSDESKQEERTENQDTKEPEGSSDTSTVKTSEDNSSSGTEAQKDESSSGESLPDSGKTEISLDSPDKMENTKPVTEPTAENEDKKHPGEKTEE